MSKSKKKNKNNSRARSKKAKRNRSREAFLVFAAGCIFGIGLALAGMTKASKVVGFFDFSDGLTSWDPSLGLVMGGAIAIYLPVYRAFAKKNETVFRSRLHLPTKTVIDRPLIVGAALFGIGWGLGGFCPGPVITTAATLQREALIVLGSTLAGMAAFHAIPKRTF